MRVEPTHHSFTIRVPTNLMKWLDRYTRIQALDREIRVTRNEVINNFLEQMREIVEFQEKHQWAGKTHIEMMQSIMEDAATKHGRKPTAEKSDSSEK